MITRISNTQQYKTILGETKPVIKLGGRDKTTRKRFVPNINFSFKDTGEERFFININHSNVIVKNQKPIFDNGISIAVGSVTTEFYESNGGLEHEIKLTTKPDSPMVELDLKHSPEIMWKEVFSTTKSSDKHNSYFAYYREEISRGGIVSEIKNPQLCQIKRSWVEDKNGKRYWCEQKINAGKWKIKIPDEVWTRSSLYPLIIGPTYLFVEDDSGSGEYYVYMDGFRVEITTDNINNAYIIDDVNNSALITGSPSVNISGTDYHASGRDPNIVMDLMANTPIYACIRYHGNFYDNGGASYLTNSTSFTFYFHFYKPDIFVIDIVWVTSGTIDLTSGYLKIPMGGSMTSEANYGGDATTEYCHTGEGCGNETDLTNQNKPTYNYMMVHGDEGNLIMMTASTDDSGNFNQRYDDPGNVQTELHDGNTSLAAGTYRHTVVIVVDTPDRAGSALAYNSTDRLNIGKQWNDLVMAAPSVGSEVTDLVIPYDLSSDGFASDISRNLEMSSDEIKYAVDIGRINHIDVIQDPPIETGTVGSSTDHLVSHWKMDDNAATTTIIDTAGNNNGTLGGGDNTQDKDSADAVRGTSFLLNGTDDYIDIDDAIGSLTSTGIFTIQFKFKPNFANDVAAHQIIFVIYENWDNNFTFRYRHDADNFEIVIALDNNSYTSSINHSSGFGSWSEFAGDDDRLQKWMTFYLAVDLSADYLFTCIYGEENTYKHSQPVTGSWGSPPTVLRVGSSSSSGYSAIYVDDVKLIDGCLLPYGSYFTGNGSVDVNHAHENVKLYWEGNDVTGTNVDIGGVQGTKGGSGGTFQTTNGVVKNNDYFDTEGTAELHFSITSEDIIDFSQGSLSMWVNIQTIGAGDALFGVGDADDHIQAALDASGNIDVTYRSQSTSETITGDIALGTGEWHHVLIKWDDTDQVACFIDGVENGTAQDIASTYAGATSDTIYFGADYAGSNLLDAYIQEVFITNDPHTPQWPIILGSGPIHGPIRGVEAA